MKYAVSECEDGGELSIVSRVQEEQLYLEVTDTGPGMEMDSAEDSRGIGLRNVRERLEALYGENQTFKLGANDPTGLTVSILIPLILADDELAGAQAEEAVFAQA